MARGLRRVHRSAKEVEHGIATRARVPATVVGGGRVLGEARGDLAPALVVDAAHVPVLQALDRLELHELGQVDRVSVCQDHDENSRGAEGRR